MPNITTCTGCGALYEAGSEEAANEQFRLCPPCLCPEDVLDHDQEPIDPRDECDHDWNYTGTQYGGEDDRWHGEGRVICRKCGADGDG